MEFNKYSSLIKDYSRGAYKLLLREGEGYLSHPFIVPGSVYDYDLWDWDSWLTDIAIRQILADNNESADEFTEYETGCAINFL